MATSKNTDPDEISELKSDAFAVSAKNLSCVEEFGRKWHDRGIKAGATQAKTKVEDSTSISVMEDARETIAALVARNEELEKQVKELNSYKDIALDAHDIVTSSGSMAWHILETEKGYMRPESFNNLRGIAADLKSARSMCKAMFNHASEKARGRSDDSPDIERKNKRQRI